MKRKFLSFAICLVLVLCTVIPLVGCIQTPKKLNAPQNVKVSNSGLITWDAVENATGYAVTIGEQQYDVTATNFQAPDAAKDFTCSVVAVAEGYDNSDASTATFTYIPSTIIIPPSEDEITLAIAGSSEVHKGKDITLRARINGKVSKSVTWSVVEGGDYITISADGVVSAKEVEGDHIVKVKATSTEDNKVSAEHVMRVLARTTLTQQMLDAFNDVERIGFEGYVSIALYSPGAIGDVLQGTYVNTIQTAMDGETWFARYDSTGAGLNQSMHVKKRANLAQQVSISLTNNEEYFPMKDNYGHDIEWEDAGLYNSFKNLRVSDFMFDEETWSWTYKYSESELVRHVVSSANPYDFEPTGLSLIIQDGEIMGIHSKSKVSRRVVQGYNAVMELLVAINLGDMVEIPEITRYSHDAEHDQLTTAINNMQSLESYKLDFIETVYTMVTPSGVRSGFEETITENECYFEPYDLVIRDGNLEKQFLDNADYGFRKISDNFYNSYAYNRDEGAYRASRAFNGDFSQSKPSFEFAAELFRAYSDDEETGERTYYVDEIMCHVATTWYKTPGNDYALYGMFATNYLLSIERFLPYVSVKDGYITEVGFFFNLGDMYGTVQIFYSEYDTARLSASHFEGVKFETRQVPNSWSQLEIQVSSGTGNTDENVSVNAETYLDEKFGAAAVPFFGEALGDCYGFGMTTTYLPANSGRMREAVAFYYDVPLDADYTLNSSINAVKALLEREGFTQNANGEFSKGKLYVCPLEQSLDFLIYVWQAD